MCLNILTFQSQTLLSRYFLGASHCILPARKNDEYVIVYLLLELQYSTDRQTVSLYMIRIYIRFFGYVLDLEWTQQVLQNNTTQY